MKFPLMFSNYESIIAAGAGIIPTLISWGWPHNEPVPLIVYIVTMYALSTIIWIMFVRHKASADMSMNSFKISHIDWDNNQLIIRNNKGVHLEVGQCLALKLIDENGYHIPVGLVSITENSEKYQANLLPVTNDKRKLKRERLDKFVITNMIHFELIRCIGEQEDIHG